MRKPARQGSKLADKGAYLDVSDRRLQVQLTLEAKIAAGCSLVRAIFAFAGFVSALRGTGQSGRFLFQFIQRDEIAMDYWKIRETFAIYGLYDAPVPAEPAGREAIERAVQAGVESVRRAPAALGDFLRTSRFPVLWEDQARVVAAQDDSVLERYIAGLLDWLAEPNQPGASRIRARILQLRPSQSTGEAIDDSIAFAERYRYPAWADALRSLRAEWRSHAGATPSCGASDPAGNNARITATDARTGEAVPSSQSCAPASPDGSGAPSRSNQRMQSSGQMTARKVFEVLDASWRKQRANAREAAPHIIAWGECDWAALNRAIQEGIRIVNEDPLEIRWFLQMGAKPMWSDEAKIVCGASDDVLERYIADLLDWALDPNWPGAWEVLFERVAKIPSGKIDRAIEATLASAGQLDDHPGRWIATLKELQEARGCGASPGLE